MPQSPSTSVNETLLNGVKQGYRFSSSDIRKASALSRAKMWSRVRDIVRLISTINAADVDDQAKMATIETCDVDANFEKNPRRLGGDSKAILWQLGDLVLASSTYRTLKQSSADEGFTQSRNQVIADVRDVLGNWAENQGDEEWGLDVLDDKELETTTL